MQRIFTHTLQLALTSALTLLTHSVLSQGSNHALDFDGVSDYVSIPHNPDFDFGTSGDFSIEFWIKSDQPGNSQAWVLNKHTDQNNFWAFTNRQAFGPPVLGATDLLTFEIANGPANIELVQSSSSFNDGTWKHVTATRESGDLKLYIDGILEDTFLGSVHTMNFTGIIEIGKLLWYGNIDAQIDEVRIWDKALSQTEIRENMCQNLNGSEPNLVAYYRMDEGIDNSCSSGEDVCDLTGNGNHGTKF